VEVGGEIYGLKVKGGKEASLVAGGKIGRNFGGKGWAEVLNGGQGLTLAGQHRVAILRQVSRLMAVDDLGQGNHLTAPQVIAKRSIKALMRTLA